MATDHAHNTNGTLGEPRNPSVLFDKSDLSARGIVIFFVVLAVFAVAMHIVVLGLYVGMTKISEKHEAEISPLATTVITPRSGILTNTADVNVRSFPEPRLQEDEAGDLQRFLLKENAVLAANPWQDPEGNVHLPIDQAMNEVVSRLPVRSGNPTVLPNYPGASREYSYPAAGDEQTAAAIDAAAEPSSTEPSFTEPSPTPNQQGNGEQSK